MKKYAYYLPQFHRIPENDKWWGEGFTEWTNVKKAKKLFIDHKQPKEPLDNNYYSLENIETMKWQGDLLKQYHLDGFIFYHYYFTGKKLLEKPIELLLKHKEVKLDFFFCWANHSWYRSWEGSKEILIEQTYGSILDWEEHFQYLLQFFNDQRYVKRDNKPIFMIFKSDFKEKNEILNYFDKRCKESGFNGICVIETMTSYNNKKIINFKNNLNNESSFIHFREPDASTVQYTNSVSHILFKVYNKVRKCMMNFGIPYIEKYSGDNLFDIMIKKKYPSKTFIRGLFFEWDNTPRHSYRGYIISPPKKELFFKYMDSIKDSEFLFINAWNEWCEGMILEPTKENGYKYLEWIKEWSEKNENRINGV